jgi:microcystin-dependent protein
MTGTNKFLPFATGGSANVITDDAYAALAALATGYQSGIAQSQQLNKTWRQSSVMAAVMGQIIANYGNNASDGDTIANLVAYLKAALMGSKASIASVSSAATLTFANIGQHVALSGSTNYAVNLPVSTACLAAGAISFQNYGSGTVTISRQGADVIVPNGTTITSIALKAGDTAEFLTDANGNWYLIDGSVALPYAAAMAGANWITQTFGDNTTKLATTAFVQAAVNALITVPTGSIIVVAQSSAPTGYLKANGAAISRSSYSALYSSIGTTYGSGDGSTTFNLPDLRGEFLRGWDDGRGVDASRAFGSNQSDAIRNITGHFGDGFYGENGQNHPSGAFSKNSNPGYTKYYNDAWTYNGPSVDFDASLVVPTASENRPRNVAMLACIKF